jgi:hypothetical protein
VKPTSVKNSRSRSDSQALSRLMRIRRKFRRK